MSGRAGRRTVLDPGDLKQWEEHLHDKSNDEVLIFVETKLGEKAPKVSEDGYKPGRKLLIEALVREADHRAQTADTGTTFPATSAGQSIFGRR